MNAAEIIKKQEEITEETFSRNKVINGRVLYPIPDGVADVEAYLKTSPRVMWILKEPYNEFEDGYPKNESPWTMMDGILDYQGKALPRTNQKMIYTMEAIRNSLPYDDMDWYWNLQDNLKSIAWVNLSKMPAYTTSPDIANRIGEWDDIVMRQIELLDPQVIIFGNTFQYVQDKPIFSNRQQISDELFDGLLDVYKSNGRILINAYHPSCPGIKNSDYVESIYKTIAKYSK